MPDKLLRVSEAATLAQVTKTTIYYWLDKGVLERVYVGPFKRVRIPESSLRKACPELELPQNDGR